MNTPQRFAGKVVLITGASSGIGRAVARAFAAEGASLVLAARRAERLKELAATFTGTPCESVVTDVQDQKQVERLVQTAIAKFGRIDVLVNNAGVGFFGPFEQQPLDSIERTLRTNLEGAINLCRLVVPHMRKQKSGSIVNVSSVVGKRAVPDFAVYCASKFGLWGFSQSLRFEVAREGIHVCHFCPALTATEFQDTSGMEKTGKTGMKPEQVAAALLDAVASRKSEHIMSLPERVVIKLFLLAPNLTHRLLNLTR